MLTTLKAKLLAGGASLALLAAAVGGGVAVHAQTSQPTQPPAATQTAQPPAVPQQAEPENGEVKGIGKVETDGPGGHADQDGVDVQHDFQGVE